MGKHPNFDELAKNATSGIYDMLGSLGRAIVSYKTDID